MAEMGIREFGRLVDKTGEAVRKAIATGKIPKDCVGTRTLASGKTRPVITDPERARRSWIGNTDPSQARDKAALSAGRAAAHARDRGEAPADNRPPPPSAGDDGGAGGQGGRGVPTITESKAIEAAYRARLARLDYEERIGKLVNAEQVKLRLVGMITSARNRLLGVPSKAKMRIPTLTVRDIEQLEEMISEALQEIAQDGS